MIDFETTPAGGTPVDDSFLSTPYNLTGGGTVSFFFDTNGNNTLDGGDSRPVFEAAGPDGNDAFTNNSLSLSDTANPGYVAQLGNFFLRELQPGPPPPPFIVDYNTSQTISGLSGEIWDIDGMPGNTEQWKVEVLDSLNNLITSQTSPLGNNGALDGLPWTFAFTGLPSGVDKLRITFVGSKVSGIGLAFNNFSPLEAVPEPSTLVLLGSGIAGVAVFWLRKRAGC